MTPYKYHSSELPGNFFELRIFLLIAFLLWVYLWLRAIYIPVAHDEVATFFYYAHTGRFLPFLSHWDANNHFLNSALTFCSYRLFGSSPIALRLPNLLFAPLFFYYCYRISQEFSHSFLRWIFLLTFYFSHSFLEFFALSRGYGMSMALMFAAIYYLIKACKTNHLRHSAGSLIFIMLATYANLALINTYLLIIGLISLKYFISKPHQPTATAPLKRPHPPAPSPEGEGGKSNFQFSAKDRRNKWLIPVVIVFAGVIPVGFFAKILMIMQQNGNLYAGSRKGFWDVTVNSLMKMLTNSHPTLFSYFVIFFFIAACFLFVWLLFRKGGFNFLSDSGGIFFCLLVGNILASLILGTFLKVNYPEDRIALYFFIFLTGSFLFLLDRILPVLKKYAGILLAFPFLFFPVQFIHRINLTYLSFYISDNIPPRFYDKVYKTFTQGNFPPTIGGERGRHFCWSYLDYRKGGWLSEIYYSDYPGLAADFQIVTTSQNPRWRDFYASIDYDKYSGRELLQRKNPLQMVMAGSGVNISTGGFTDTEYFTLYEQKTGLLAGKPLCITLDLSLECKAKPFVAWIVTTVVDNKGTAFSYERIPLDWMRSEWKGPGNNLKDVMLVPEVPAGATKVATYLWNMEKVPYSLNNGNFVLYTIVPDWK
ncbi:MAG: hypothetical protein NTX61_01805 [Bacteroidetes bacterium]|nr:hypothetical protein [Bacteroidota bacterium]